MSAPAIISKTLWTAKSSLNEYGGTDGILGPGIMSRARDMSIYLEWGSGVVSGAVTIESAASADYAGTWAPLAPVAFSGSAPKTDIVQVIGVHGAIRARISTGLSGGTAAAKVVVN